MTKHNEYSFARALQHLADPNAPGAREAATFERDIAQRAGGGRGFNVPGAALARALDAGTAGAGAELVSDADVTGFAGALRARTVIGEAGATILEGLRGDASVPTMTAGAAASWLSDGGAVGNSAPVLAPGSIQPKTIAASIPVSRRMLLQGSPDVAALVAADLVAAIGAELDRAALGASADPNAPPGLIQAIAATRVPWSGAEPTHDEILALVEAVHTANAQSPAIVAAPSFATAARKIDAGGVPALRDGRIADLPAFTASSVPADEMIVGGFADLVIGMWGGLDLRIDAGTGAARDARIMRCFADVGFLVRRTSSFASGGLA